MKFGLMTFPGLFNSFYDANPTKLSQRLEPSVLYVAPEQGESVFLPENRPQDDIDVYICSVYTRGWGEFKKFSERVGREKVIAGGYHATALPQETLSYASYVVTGYCKNIDDILGSPPGIYPGTFGFTPMRRDLINMRAMRQVYPDIMPEDVSGSMVSSVGCPFDCEFCATPNMSGKEMRVSGLEYVQQEIADLLSRDVTTVFIRDESFATNPKIKDIAECFKGQFRIVYSFGTGAVMAKRPDIVKHLVDSGWHSLNFGLEDIGVTYRKNRDLKIATENCQKNGMKYVMSFIVNDANKSQEEARANYNALYNAFIDLKPSQVCANFMMPFPGTGIWKQYKDRITEADFEKFDSKTPIFSSGALAEWHKRMMVAVQIKYYESDTYDQHVRSFACGDNLFLRIQELKKEYDLEGTAWDSLLEV